MKRVIHYFLLIVAAMFILIGCANTPRDQILTASYVVAGDARHFANGQYIETGEYNFRPLYSMVGNANLKIGFSAEENTWVIFETIDQKVLYKSITNGDLPPQSGWRTPAGESAHVSVALSYE